MALFQKTVIKKHLLDANTTEVDAAYQRFSAYFHDSVRQQNIRNSKEEQFQEGFLRELFGHIFGYTLNPEPNFNLTTELKNTSNSKKVDGAIVFDGKAIAVIELKGTNTTDLNSIETQAFGYKNNQPECVYVITSNFEKLRFYIDNSIDYEEFNLFTLSREQFNLLYLCLSLPSIQQNLPKRLKDESVSQEDAITKKLYKDYSEFKRALYHNLVELNPEFDKLLLFKKTQKLLDRFLFIFFAEDRLLLPTNLIFRINQEWKNLMKMRMTVSLYERYKVYFNDLNLGAKVTLPAFGKKTGDAIEAEFEIFAYNGGLFAPDDLLDQVKINDDVLHVYTEKMSHYDFDSDVDVNILGHIFENSLNEIDEIKSEIEGETVDKTKTRRKKDGVFYTPKYITKYIVDNTVGKLCAEKKAELNLADEDYTNDKKIQTKTKKAHLDKLTDYRAWLLQLTICDPACGSGAFLNQALEFLIAEHRYVDELQAKLMGDSMILSDVETSILENNIYGVDLNDESVEIAKLSLWLRTAQKGRKLNSLNNNIKCGNSLIDDPEVAEDKAFSWEKEFPEVFKEKNKFPFHITTSLHDSRTSERMIKYKARERRFEGTKPDPEVFPMTKEEEELIATTVADIAKEDNLNIAAFNLCWDHMHILLVCEEEEVPKIMHKIKGRTARACNVLRNKGINPLDALRKDGSIPFWTQKYGCKPITSDDQFWNTYNYIENNKVKHNLPKNPKLEKIILGFVKTYEDCFKSEYIGGFDVVIGNPPYLRVQGLKEHYFDQTKYYESKFISATGNYDIYVLFMEKTLDLISENGTVSYILPHKFLVSEFGVGIRSFFKNTQSLKEIIHFGSELVFEDASTYTCICTFAKKKTDFLLYASILPNQLHGQFKFENINLIDLLDDKWELSRFKNKSIFSKISSKEDKIGNYINVFSGIQTSADNIYILTGSIKGSFLITEFGLIELEILRPVLKGNNIKKYDILESSSYVIFPYYIRDNSAELISETDLIKKYPNCYSYLKENESKLRGREKGKMNHDKWYAYGRLQNLVLSNGPKLISPDITLGLNITYDNGDFCLKNGAYGIQLKREDLFYTIYAVLNSSLLWFYLSSSGNVLRGNYFRFNTKYIEPFYFDQKLAREDFFKEKIEQISQLNSLFKNTVSKLLTLVQFEFGLIEYSNSLKSWFNLTFAEFLVELKKKKIELSVNQKSEWLDFYESEKSKVVAIKSQIDHTDKEIDRMVYELYGLTEEEIKIVSRETAYN
jgi:REP element-mobilizing transposase RayT